MNYFFVNSSLSELFLRQLQIIDIDDGRFLLNDERHIRDSFGMRSLVVLEVMVGFILHLVLILEFDELRAFCFFDDC